MAGGQSGRCDGLSRGRCDFWEEALWPEADFAPPGVLSVGAVDCGALIGGEIVVGEHKFQNLLSGVGEQGRKGGGGEVGLARA